MKKLNVKKFRKGGLWFEMTQTAPGTASGCFGGRGLGCAHVDFEAGQMVWHGVFLRDQALVAHFEAAVAAWLEAN